MPMMPYAMCRPFMSMRMHGLAAVVGSRALVVLLRAALGCLRS